MQSLFKSSLLILALGIGTSAFAQDQQTTPAVPAPMHQANPAHEIKRLSKELGLTAEQKSQIEPILADRQQRESALASNTALDEKSMRKQRRAIMLDSQQKINAVLTPTQQQQLAALRAERHQGKSAGQSAPPPAV